MATCGRCMVNEANGLLCATCLLAKQQEEQFRIQQDQINPNLNSPSTSSEMFSQFLGLIILCSLITWWWSDMGFWESIVAVLKFPFYAIVILLGIFGVI